MIGDFEKRLDRVDSAVRLEAMMQRRKYRECLVTLSLESLKRNFLAQDMGGVQILPSDNGLVFVSTLGGETKQLTINLVDADDMDASSEYLEWRDEILHLAAFLHDFEAKKEGSHDEP